MAAKDHLNVYDTEGKRLADLEARSTAAAST
jgi:hypothetical protein